MVKSVYDYITKEELEASSGKTYSNINEMFTDEIIVAQISMAERVVNDIKKKSFSGTIPDDVIVATLLIAKRLMNNLIIELGFGKEGEEPIEVIDNELIKSLLTDSSKKYDYKLKQNVTSRFFED